MAIDQFVEPPDPFQPSAVLAALAGLGIHFSQGTPDGHFIPLAVGGHDVGRARRWRRAVWHDGPGGKGLPGLPAAKSREEMPIRARHPKAPRNRLISRLLAAFVALDALRHDTVRTAIECRGACCNRGDAPAPFRGRRHCRACAQADRTAARSRPSCGRAASQDCGHSMRASHRAEHLPVARADMPDNANEAGAVHAARRTATAP